MKKHRAYSLIEVMLAISLVIILAAITLPRVVNFDSTTITSELQAIETVIHFLQQKALACNHEQELIIDTQNQNYSYQGSFPPKKMILPLKHNIIFGVMPNVKGPPAKPEKILATPCTFESIANKPGHYKVIIFSNGKISSGTIYLTNKNKNCLGALTCPISQVSWIRIYAYENGRWVTK